MFLSVIVPAYNVEQYIDKCIESLINQDIDDYEIIIVNDASTDKTVDKVINWKNDRIIFVNKEKNSGLSSTRNEGMKIAKGKYIAFVDSDDYLEFNSFSKLKKQIEDMKEIDAIYMGYYLHRYNRIEKYYDFYSEKNRKFKATSFLKYELKHRGIPVPACFAVYRREFLEKNNILFRVGILHEDELWSPTILFKADLVATTNICIYHYIIRSGSITQKKDRTQNGIDKLYICKQLFEMTKSQLDENVKKLMNNHISMLYMKAMCEGKLYRKPYSQKIDRTFPIKNVCFLKDIVKGILFAISLRIYYLFDCLMGQKL